MHAQAELLRLRAGLRIAGGQQEICSVGTMAVEGKAAKAFVAIRFDQSGEPGLQAGP